MHYAAAHGRLDRVKWLHANTTEQCRYDTMAVAARNGHGDVVRWLQHNRPESHKSMTHRIMDFAASRGFLEVVQVLHEERKEGCTTIAMDGAAGIGHLQVVQYLHAHRKEGCTPAAFDTAAANGHLAVVEWLHEYRSESGTKAASFGAAVNGHVEVVRFLLNHRDSGYVDEGIRLAIPNLLVKGDSVVLPLLLTDCPELFPLFSMAMAAENGHLDVIKLLHPTRPREDIEEALVRGAKNYPAIVDYLLENDKFSTPVLKSAVDRARTLAVSVKLHQHILPEANTVNVFGLAPSPKPCSRARRKAKKPMLLARRQQFACT
ncbi:hypothetical protein Poli38472_014375 [Pythium oligandrum]|uniref:Ankyrin repeat-containing domain n=1 Tax=Pythium oligandrum TaxID=41045 RepID=A0A8K1C745_PYTOL|nr:hypothetical protein Poli38472_014375 [Pythium oligandrum]|eukprot:TMW57772.1 hypothetical protein Poli38472_014375 [Pythium oligandrum]